MTSVRFCLYAVVASWVGGCAGINTTPISELTLPPVTTIEGTIMHLDEGGFTVTDGSGSIAVRANLAGNKRLNLALNEQVKIYGNLQSGQDRVFDGYVIRKATGEQIIVSSPTPHLGCIIQSSFE